MSELISKEQAINALFEWGWDNKDDRDAVDVICGLPTINNEPHWIPVTKEEMFKAGYEGREIRFKVDGRLFAIRELAQ